MLAKGKHPLLPTELCPNFAYALGSALSVATWNSVNGDYGRGTNTLTTNLYTYRDGAVQSRIIYDSNTEDGYNLSPTDPNHNYTSFSYDTQGQLTSAYVKEYTAHSVNFTNDENGQIIRITVPRAIYPNY